MIKEEGNPVVGILNVLIIEGIIGLIILTINEVWLWKFILIPE